MILCFRKSRLSLVISAVVIAALSCAIVLYDKGKPVYVPILSVFLIILIGSLAAILLANNVASAENQRLLGILHIDLDPQRFIREYSPVPARAFAGPSRILALANLADGYAAAGDFAKALETLQAPGNECKEKDRLSLSCLYASSRCRYTILSGDAAGAEKCMSALANAISEASRTLPALSKNMKDTMSLWRILLNDIEDKDVSADYVSREISGAGYNIMRLELQWVLARQYERSGDTAAAKSAYETIAREAGGLYLAERARSH